MSPHTDPGFRDRPDAGRALAALLANHGPWTDALVLALPRGGVPVADEVARVLELPLDVLIVRKLGVPGQPELAMGAIAGGGLRVLNEDVLRQFRIGDAAVEAAAQAEEKELARRERLYRGPRKAPPLAGRTVILVDDGLATGATMRAAVRALRAQGDDAPARIVVAVPVASGDTADALRAEFDQTDDAEVQRLLRQAWQRQPGGPPRGVPP
jgi:putative phosphoribosyl transferase